MGLLSKIFGGSSSFGPLQIRVIKKAFALDVSGFIVQCKGTIPVYSRKRVGLIISLMCKDEDGNLSPVLSFIGEAQEEQTSAYQHIHEIGVVDGRSLGYPEWGGIAAIVPDLIQPAYGGIQRIGQATEKIVPLMVLLYVGASLFIILTNISMLPNVISEIFTQAFLPDAVFGGFVGVLVTGIKRAVFSNEGGVGSASIAHSAAKTDEPVREGIVAMIGPFIDTIIVCFMTASVILITADNNPVYQDASNLISMHGKSMVGASMTSEAFDSVIPGFKWILAIVVFLFSYSTIISWYYYGDKGWKYLFGSSSIKVYQGMYLGCIVLGSVVSLGNVIDFSDMMILSCGFPNIIGCLFLLPLLKTKLDDYWSRYQAGEFKTYK